MIDEIFGIQINREIKRIADMNRGMWRAEKLIQDISIKLNKGLERIIIKALKMGYSIEEIHIKQYDGHPERQEVWVGDRLFGSIEYGVMRNKIIIVEKERGDNGYK